jgi:uncharacterized membrane protein YhaH (DUF805 family)
MNLVGLMLNPTGRIGRRDYWVGVAIITAIIVWVNWSEVRFGAVLGCSTIYLGICVHGKRLHDIGSSAWGILVPVAFFPLIVIVTILSGGLANPASESPRAPDTPLASFVDALPLLITFILPAWVIWLGSRKSQPGDNKYGPGRDVAAATTVD